MTNLLKELNAREPVRSFEELTPAAQDVLQNACIETCKRNRDYDVTDIGTYLVPIYLNEKADEATKCAQFDALHFLRCLEKIIFEQSDEIYYKRDDHGTWWQLDFEELANDAGFSAWRADATYTAIFGIREPGDNLETAVYSAVAKVLDDYDRASVFVTNEKPEDFEE